ncbi:unnamed protein product [Cyprideis torosa]|uniref:Plexin TIG domain-containing protein n=1 Tax=Cyprideis torosa TaxID=163714 RepID=A0A7R8W3J8_9CRUS|nr:unnamed protein product [Cyprideis torosa]CAG0883073.1 unnamed protein product [Cyprideis torosa]
MRARLQMRCTIRGACRNATHGSPRWLNFGSGQQCIDFEQVVPDRIPIKESVTVQLTIRTLPSLPRGAKYQCVFGTAKPIDAVVTSFGLSCLTPSLRSRPQISPGEDHALVPLSVRSSETNKDFVSRAGRRTHLVSGSSCSSGSSCLAHAMLPSSDTSRPLAACRRRKLMHRTKSRKDQCLLQIQVHHPVVVNGEGVCQSTS